MRPIKSILLRFSPFVALILYVLIFEDYDFSDKEWRSVTIFAIPAIILAFMICAHDGNFREPF